jgi:hypothetical protein
VSCPPFGSFLRERERESVEGESELRRGSRSSLFPLKNFNNKKQILSWTRPRSQYRSPLPPVLVTDLTEEAALLSAAAVRKVLADAAAAAVADERTEEEGGGDEAGRGGRFRRFRVTDPTLNPFRSPARVRAPGGTALPAAAGGWAFWILEEKKEEVEENEKNE